MFFGVLIITVVYLPILALSGIEGKMFHPMALTLMLALCSLFLSGNIKEKENFVFTRLGAEFVPKLDEGSTTMMLYRTAPARKCSVRLRRS